MNLFGFTDAEIIPFLGMLIVSLWLLIRNYRKGYREVWSPLSIMVIVFGYYCLLGPYEAVTTGKTMDRLLNMRPFYTSALWGAFISMLSFSIGFAVNQMKARVASFENSDEELLNFGKKICFAGFILFTISTGGQIASLINPFDAEAVASSGGSFANYFAMSINLMIPGVALLFAYFIKTHKGLVWFIVFFIVALGLFTTLGFRFRIVLLATSLVIIYYTLAKRRPNLIVIIPGLFLFISLMGFIGSTRRYGSGLNLAKIDKTDKTYYASGLEEALIFQTSGAIIDLTPGVIPFAGLTPIISTIMFPVPRVIYAEKSSADYLFNALDQIYGKRYSKGAAFMMYAEYYLAFGWIGLIAGSFLLGWFYKRLWTWYIANQHNVFVTAIYAVTVSFLYVIMSRGYMPLVTMIFFFSVYPIYFAWGRVKKKYKMKPKGIRPLLSRDEKQISEPLSA